VAEIAIIHFTNYPKGQTRSSMAAVMKYTMREEKTLWDGKQLVSGINCRPESVYDDFLRTKLPYHKDGGTLFFHMVQSFPAGEEVDPVAAHAAALRLADYFDGREVLVSTHTDRDHIHSHFLINSVSFENGKKLHISELELTELRQRNDQICIEFGLPVFQPQKKKQTKTISGAEYHAAAKGESWKFRLMNTIDECMKYAHDPQEFITLMRSEGYDVRWTDGRKNITYTTPDGKRCRNDWLHDTKYLKENMEYEFRIREEIITGGVAADEYAQQLPPPERHPTAQDWLELTAALMAVGELLADLSITLENQPTQDYPWPKQDQEQLTELLLETKAIHRLLEQAGKKKERHFSLPHISLPRPSLTWLIVPAILLGLLALWYGWAALWNGLATLFP